MQGTPYIVEAWDTYDGKWRTWARFADYWWALGFGADEFGRPIREMGNVWRLREGRRVLLRSDEADYAVEAAKVGR